MTVIERVHFLSERGLSVKDGGRLEKSSSDTVERSDRASLLRSWDRELRSSVWRLESSPWMAAGFSVGFVTNTVLY